MVRKVRQGRRGAAAVELALLLPFLVFIFAIAVDWSRVIYYTVTINNCARNGALWLSDPYATTISPYATLTAAALADAPNLNPQPTVTTPPVSGVDVNGYAYVECTVSYPFQTLTNIPGVPTTTTITRTVRMYTAPQTPN
jgi:Flp pilus assembly protein TadG